LGPPLYIQRNEKCGIEENHPQWAYLNLLNVFKKIKGTHEENI
jgi:hypothetical protein